MSEKRHQMNRWACLSRKSLKCHASSNVAEKVSSTPYLPQDEHTLEHKPWEIM
jgi:hypothetical protein